MDTQPPVFGSATSSAFITSLFAASVSKFFKMSDPFPEIKSKHSLVAKYVTKPIWEKLSRAMTATSGFTLAKAIACAVEFDNQDWKIHRWIWTLPWNYKGTETWCREPYEEGFC